MVRTRGYLLGVLTGYLPLTKVAGCPPFSLPLVRL